MDKPSISIHYCPGCKWLTRTSWMAQELLDTFANDLASVALCPAEVPGAFRIVLKAGSEAAEQVVWDRTVDVGFPQIKELKKRVRDIIAPERESGHLDR